MQDFEKLGAFYLGREYDWRAGKTGDGLVLYDSRDLTTHAVCVGMTGSGKTGLCVALLEEAAIDGIPALVIDPKGDLTNLLLTFPDLAPSDFQPWIQADDARRKGAGEAEYAAQQAELWRDGLAAWGQDGARIRRLREAAEFAVYTPGSGAGLPVSILKSFAAPRPAVRDDADLFRDQVQSTATSLLGLLGLDADPLQSREHILLATILQDAWTKGEDLDLGSLIQRIQKPPVTRIGVLEIEAFFPSKERFDLAMRINNLLAAPGFQTWLEGAPLDVQELLYTPTGRPRVAIFSIAHLSDAERMFFVSLLLNATLAWMRAQSGTTSLRALLYMDEIFGYFPPTANPPSKQPLLTLMKQARAFGLGVVLSTQNPVDLDYKGLANAGTWFIGRLQTERDKARLLDGLESVRAGAFERATLEELLASLGKRVFLLHNVHDDAPMTFETRWVMSYLRGPLTRDQIQRLGQTAPAVAPAAVPDRTSAAAGAAPTVPAAPASAAPAAAPAPVLPPDVPQHFAPVASIRPDGGRLAYEPVLFGSVALEFHDAKKGIEVQRSLHVVTGFASTPGASTWDGAEPAPFDPAHLETAAQAGATYSELPAAAARAASYDRWRRDLVDWAYRNERLELWRSAEHRLVSQPDESERDFRLRLQQASREARDAQAETLRGKYAPKRAQLEERLRRAEQAREREQSQLQQQKVSTAVSLGATLLGAFLGRKAVSRTTLGRATTTARGVGRARKEAEDVARAEENVEVLRARLQDLDAEFASEVAALETAIDPQRQALERLELRPKKTTIAARSVSLVWLPRWITPDGGATPAWPRRAGDAMM